MYTTKQKLVLDFIIDHVPIENRPKFFALIKKWDGGKGVLNSFYDLDILERFKKEAMEKII